jgi:O-antigen ligase
MATMDGPVVLEREEAVHATPHATRAERAALRVLQFGALAVVLSATTWKVFELDRFFVPKDLALHLTAFAAGLLAVGAVRRVRFTRVDLLLAAFLVVSVISAAGATNPWLAARAVAITASGIAIFWAARGLRAAGLAGPLLAGLAVAVVVGTATALLQAYGVRTEFFSLNRAPGGTLGNRNFIAHLAAFGMPVVLLVALRAARAPGYLLATAGVMVVTAALILTRSRAGWLAFGAVVLVFMVALVVAAPLRRHARTWLRLLGVLAVAGAGVAAALLLPNTLQWRSDNPYLESVRGVANFQEGSGRGRLIQYRQSLSMAAAHPVLGVGPGNWSVVYPDYAAARDPSLDRSEAGMTANPWPSSDWVAFVSERGLAATLLLGLALLGIALSALRRLLSAADADEALAAAAVMATVAAAVIAGALDAVLLLALPGLLVWAALGALWSAGGPPRGAAARRAQALALVFVALAAGAGAARSGAQLAAMGIYAEGDAAWLPHAARIDPGSYRVHVRLARNGGREQRCRHAEAAHALFPNAGSARELRRGCGG